MTKERKQYERVIIAPNHHQVSPHIVAYPYTRAASNTSAVEWAMLIEDSLGGGGGAEGGAADEMCSLVLLRARTANF